MTTTLSFFVPGIPAPGGSKRFVGFGKKTGRAILIDAAGQRNKDWRASVAMVAASRMAGQALLSGPLAVTFVFFMPRPKGHFRKGGELTRTAPPYPTTKPDSLKLARSTEDAMTGVVWGDDAQTVNLQIFKRYAGGSCGCQVDIQAMRDPRDAECSSCETVDWAARLAK